MTVQQWLELARDAGLPWAESALSQMNLDRTCLEVDSLLKAVREFALWESTEQGPFYWADVALAQHIDPHSEQDLRALAAARKEAP